MGSYYVSRTQEEKVCLNASVFVCSHLFQSSTVLWSFGRIYPLSWNFENVRDVFFLFCLVEFVTLRRWVISCVFSTQAPSRLQCGATLNTSIKACCGRYGLLQCCNYNTCALKERFASLTATRSSIISQCKCEACIVIMSAEHKNNTKVWVVPD